MSASIFVLLALLEEGEASEADIEALRREISLRKHLIPYDVRTILNEYIEELLNGKNTNS